VLERIRRFRAHPALWAWYLYDEPKMEMLTRVQETATAIRREDSGHSLIIAANETEFAALADKVFAYRYPVKDKPFPLENLEPFVRRIDQAAAGNIPFCGLLQTFNWNRYWKFEKMRRDNRHPTIEELRFMAFYGVMKGASGVFFFSFQTLPVEYRNMAHVAALIGELKRIRGYLTGEQVDPKTYTNHPHAAAWRQDGRTLLIVCNPGPQKIEAAMLPGPWILRDPQHSDKLIPGRPLPLNPWDVRLIVVTGK
jgi:hypothetical protein